MVQGAVAMTAVAMTAAALNYAKKGMPVFPCDPKTKRPLTPHGFKDASTDAATIRDWWREHPSAMIGLPTGEVSGIFALDIDVKNGQPGLESLKSLEAAHEPLSETKRTRTASGGLHYLFRYPAGLTLGNSAGKLGIGLDTRGRGGYIIVPPSKSTAGDYWFETPGTPLADPPQWLIDLLTAKPATPSRMDTTPHGASAYAQKALGGELAKVALAAKGERNHILNSASFSLGRLVAGGELDQPEVENCLLDAALRCGLPESEARKTIASGLAKGMLEPRTVPERISTVGTDVPFSSEGPEGDGEEPEESRILPPPPEVPLDAFPAEVRTMLREAAEAFTVPLQIPTACLLGVLSCLVGGTRLISLRPSWREPGNIWIATVAPSGLGKTPCATAFFNPVKHLEYEAFKLWREEYVSYENELEFCRKERARAKRGDSLPDRPIPPKRRQAYVDDTTVEALGVVLSENPRGIMWRKDELAGLIADLDKYSSGNSGGGTRSRLLSSYDGQEWKTSRTSDPTRNLYIPRAHVGIFGGIQPAMLPKVFETGASGVDEASGFLQRFMLIRAERERPGYWTERYLSPESKNLLDSIVTALWAWDIEYDADGRENEKIVPVSREANSCARL
jgi:hypothetical protein